MTNQEQYERMIIADNTAPNYKQYLLDCAKHISDYCKGFDYCTDCQFMRDCIGCIFNNIAPYRWSEFIEEKEKKTT